ncbi:MAG TPA: sigma-70 family RNA polymerase sigma factor [Acidimicrobiales bacterium]|nr:sigma-70 family RNA polymerase sigma factor [Acidimicrobiales bacterium]
MYEEDAAREWVQGTVAGRFDDGFEAWYGAEHDRLIAALVLTTGDIELATDGVDEAFSRALEKWERVRLMDSPTGWVYRVALNRVRRVARRRSAEQILLRRIPPSAPLPSRATSLWSRVVDLSERQREVIVLRYVIDLKESEIAEALGVSRGTVSSTLHEARKRLGRMLDEE